MTYGEAYQRLFPTVEEILEMKPIVIRNIKRADSNAVGTLAAVGVSTAHEALGRSGLMKPYMRPIWAGRTDRGSRGYRACTTWRQLDDPRRRRTMSER